MGSRRRRSRRRCSRVRHAPRGRYLWVQSDNASRQCIARCPLRSHDLSGRFRSDVTVPEWVEVVKQRVDLSGFTGPYSPERYIRNVTVVHTLMTTSQTPRDRNALPVFDEDSNGTSESGAYMNHPPDDVSFQIRFTAIPMTMHTAPRATAITCRWNRFMVAILAQRIRLKVTHHRPTAGVPTTRWTAHVPVRVAEHRRADLSVRQPLAAPLLCAEVMASLRDALGTSPAQFESNASISSNGSVSIAFERLRRQRSSALEPWPSRR